MPAVIVLGMHRSGTSVAAMMLDALGVAMGPADASSDAWVGRHWSNPTGHYENPDFVRLNARLVGYGVAGVREAALSADVAARAGPLAAEIEATIRAATRERWGWKDPWTVLTLEVLLPYVPDPRFVFVSRDPAAVARSLTRRDGTPDAEGLRIAAAFADRLARIRAAHPTVPSLELTFDEVTGNPADAARRLAEFVGAPADPARDRRIAAGVLDDAALHREELRLARRELATFPKWMGWLVARELRFDRRGLGPLWSNVVVEFSGTFRAAVSPRVAPR